MANTEVGAAYVSIMPSMKGFQQEVSSGVKGAFSSIKGVVAGALSTGAVAAFGKAALDSYAQFEQLVGGVDKLFGDASSKLQAYAADAYKTSGMSANRYMEQATSFSASLISSLGGDTAQAADLANTAMVSMADNVNVFGSEMEDVQNAFQGFAKQNFTMLDNLRLGYGGTQSEMLRLIKDASRLTDVQKQLGLTVDEGSLSFDNIVKAIQVVQTEMGITGTTAAEAAKTIEGSITMMKASWQNWLTGLGNEDADMGTLTDQLVESVITAGRNVVPRVGEIAVSFGSTLASKAPDIASMFSGALMSALPPSISGAISTAAGQVSEAVGGIVEAAGGLEGLASKVAGAVGAFAAFAGVKSSLTFLTGLGPQLMEAGRGAQFFVSQFMGISRMQGVGSALSAVKTSLTATGGALSGIISPVGIAVAAIASLAAAFAYFYTANDGFRETINGIASTMMSLLAPAIESIMTTLQNMAATVMPLIMSAIQAVSPAIMQVLTVISQVVAVVIPLVAQIAATVLPIIASIVTAIVQVATAVITAVMPVVTQILTVIQTAMPLILAVVTSAMNGILGIVQAVWPFIQSIVTTVMGAVKAVIDTVWPAIQTVVNTVLQAIQTIIVAVMQVIQGDWEGAWETIRGFLDGCWEGIKNAVQTGIENIVNFFVDLPGKITSALAGLPTLLIDAGRSVIDGFLSGLKQAWDGVVGWFGEITSMIPSLKGPIKVDAKLLVGNGETIMGGLLDGLTSGWYDVEDFLAEKTLDISNIKANPMGIIDAAGGMVLGGDINQTLNFNQPVQTPAQYARYVRRLAHYGLAGER